MADLVSLAASLSETAANLDAYIDRYAQQQAAERVAEAQAIANAAIREANAETEEVRALLERERDLTAELRRHVDMRDRHAEQEQDARVRIAAAVGEAPYKQWPILAAKVELRLAEQDATAGEGRGHDPV